MIKIGEYNKLEVIKERDFGFFLADKRKNEILLPKSLLNGNEIEVGDEVNVFAYMDSQGRPVATMKKPLIEVGKVADIPADYFGNIGVPITFINFCK